MSESKCINCETRPIVDHEKGLCCECVAPMARSEEGELLCELCEADEVVNWCGGCKRGLCSAHYDDHTCEGDVAPEPEKPNVACPFCGETDFDLSGLKQHLIHGGAFHEPCKAFKEMT